MHDIQEIVIELRCKFTNQSIIELPFRILNDMQEEYYFQLIQHEFLRDTAKDFEKRECYGNLIQNAYWYTF